MTHLTNIELIAIASSFGGLEANLTILSYLPTQITPAIVVLTHLTENSEASYAQVLSKKTGHKIEIAQDKSLIQAGHIYLAPGGYHLLVESNKTFALSEDHKVNNVRPSADVFFESLAPVYKDKVIAIVLTGANSDGAAGIKAIFHQGGAGIIQSPETAVADAMPRAAIEACNGCTISPLERIPEKILDWIR